MSSSSSGRKGHRSRQKVPGTVVAWVTTWLGRITLHDRSDQVEPEEGSPFSLTMSFAVSGGYRTFDLTVLTEEELNKLIEFFALVEQSIRPVIQLRDRNARSAQEAGDRTFTRSYRALPQLVVFSRTAGEHTTSVLQRPQDPDPGSGTVDSSGQSGGGGDAVAESSPEPAGTEDNSQENDGPTDIRTLERDW